MKTPILLNDWKDATIEAVFYEFVDTPWNAYKESEPVPVLERPEFIGVELLLASYSYESYSGDAFVLFRRDGKLYEVNGGHCSCYGLEGQWEPEETTVAELKHRIVDGKFGSSYCGNEYGAELSQLLESLQ